MKTPARSTGALTGILDRRSARVLAATNFALIPAAIVWDWSVFDIVFLYWAENVVIGAFNVLRMAVSSPAPAPPRVSIRGNRFPAAGSAVRHARYAHHAFKLLFIPFFALHYGGFCYAHGIFVISLLDDGGPGSIGAVLSSMTPAMAAAVGLLAASHGFSFVSNYLLGGEFRRINVAALMIRPYGRIVALHVTILLGALLVARLGSPVALLAVLVAAKTAVDLGLHRAERDQLRELG